MIEPNLVEELLPSSDPTVWKFLKIQNRADPTQIAQRMAREGKVPHLKVGGRFKFSLPALQRWAAEKINNSVATTVAQEPAPASAEAQ